MKRALTYLLLCSLALSLTLFGGVIAAFVGPGFVFAANQISAVQYYGISYGFIALVSVAVLALIVFTPIKSNASQHAENDAGNDAGAPSSQGFQTYMSYPYVAAVLTGAVGYGVMALLMTAAHSYPRVPSPSLP